MKPTNDLEILAPSITKAASQQTFYTIRFLVDRERVADAYRAYSYFRWVDDVLDAGWTLSAGEIAECHSFIQRQIFLLRQCYEGKPVLDASVEEDMLVKLIRNDTGKNNGLQLYLRNMMAVMSFDADRRGRLISQTELNEYTRWLATGVTEAMHYFIGHCCYAPHNETRYLAVTAAHITHMLRDTMDDIQAGYFNIPREVLDAHHITPHDVGSDAYRAWVRSRVELARTYFRRGKEYLYEVENLRCRMAGFAYTARFEGLLTTIEQENYYLRSQYPERKKVGAGIRMLGSALSAMFHVPKIGEPSEVVRLHS